MDPFSQSEDKTDWAKELKGFVPVGPDGRSVIPELVGRDPTADEEILISGTEIPLSSSNVATMRWQWGLPSAGVNVYEPRLYVRFLNGSLYSYAGVSLETALAFKNAPSPGRFVWQRLRDQYPTSRL